MSFFHLSGNRQHSHRRGRRGCSIFRRKFPLSVSHVSSLSGERSSARRVRASPATSHAWRQADGECSILASCKALWAAPLSRAAIHLVFDISHGRRKTISPRSTDANRLRLLTAPFSECSRARNMYHSLMARSTHSELEVAASWFGRCGPRA